MTIAEIVALADQVARFAERAKKNPALHPYHPETPALATAISALLSPPPGALAWERPAPDNVAHDGACVTVPASWGGIRVSSEDARAMAVLLLEAADDAEEGK